MSAVAARRAVLVVVWIAAAAASVAEVRVERLPDGTLTMVNRGAPAQVTAARPPRPEIDRLIETHSQRQDLDPDLVRAVVRVESSFNPHARSRKGAMGLMQLMPATANSLDVDDPYDPEQNLRGGTTYLRRMLDRFGGDLELALAGYNAGPEAVDRYRGLPPYPETHAYVDRVLRLFRGEGLRARSPGERRGRPTYIHRDASGRLVMSTYRPSGS